MFQPTEIAPSFELYDIVTTARYGQDKEIPRTEEGLLYLNDEDKDYWGEYPPDEVVIATGSARKALMMMRQHHGFTFPGSHVFENRMHWKQRPQEAYVKGYKARKAKRPLELQDYFHKFIFNGNKALKGKVLIGYLHGVPVYAQTQHGETGSNIDPHLQARLKVQDVAKMYEGQNVLVISTDTVDKPATTKTPLGKPMYEADFPKNEPYETQAHYEEAIELFEERFGSFTPEERQKYAAELAFIRPRRDGFSVEEHEAAALTFLKLFKERYFPLGTSITHTNAVAVLDAISQQLVNPWEQGIILSLKVEGKRAKSAKAGRDVGGGGVLQQLIDWKIEPDDMVPWLDKLSQTELKFQDKYVILWAVYCQIAGAPYHAMKEIVREAAHDEARIEAVKQKIVLDKNKVELLRYYQDELLTDEDMVALVDSGQLRLKDAPEVVQEIIREREEVQKRAEEAMRGEVIIEDSEGVIFAH